MKVEIIVPVKYRGVNYAADKSYTVDDETAKRWVKHGIAKLCDTGRSGVVSESDRGRTEPTVPKRSKNSKSDNNPAEKLDIPEQPEGT